LDQEFDRFDLAVAVVVTRLGDVRRVGQERRLAVRRFRRTARRLGGIRRSRLAVRRLRRPVRRFGAVPERRGGRLRLPVRPLSRRGQVEREVGDVVRAAVAIEPAPVSAVTTITSLVRHVHVGRLHALYFSPF
jgi:hypothetical protein